jgi:16S rRNA (uracil1498-N3)-methyltransferase
VKQFLLQQKPDAQGYVRLTGGDYHYLVRVRRFKTGDGFTALLPDGRKAHVEVRQDDGRGILLQCVAGLKERAVPDGFSAMPPLYLFQAVPKGAKIDLIVRQATENGVAAVVPFFAERGQKRELRTARLANIIREARQQSGSEVNTYVENPLTFEKMLEHWQELKNAAGGNAAAVFLHELPLQKTSFHEAFAKNPQAAALAIGPEGGFAEEETQGFMQYGFVPVLAGINILRAETAALYALAAARTVLLERELWTIRQREQAEKP